MLGQMHLLTTATYGNSSRRTGLGPAEANSITSVDPSWLQDGSFMQY
jgi:hypothetical protein